MVREAEYQEMAENVDVRDNPTSNNQSNSHRGMQPQERKENQNRKEKNHSSRPKYFQSNAGRKPNTNPGNTPHKNNHSGGQPYQNQKNHSSLSKKPIPSNRNLSPEDREELKAAGKCFICKREGHFSRNCPDKSRQTSGGNKPPGLSANSIHFHESLDFEQTEQWRINSLGKTTTSISIGMVKIGRGNEDVEAEFWIHELDKEYDSEGDTIPDLQSVSDSDEEIEDQYHNASDDEVAQMLTEPEEAIDKYDKKVLLAPPMKFESVYPATVEDGEEKIILIDMEEGPRHRLGHAVAQKAEDMLEILQPYPGDPANVLQRHGQHFLAFVVDGKEIFIHDQVFDSFTSIEYS
ncbi:hypothetical protein C0993_002933 [Termitomyces sp. T159_Od127]|nr:hypothetical protein C0993_002933 [Termitomyces sp. T159_Od127]